MRLKGSDCVLCQTISVDVFETKKQATYSFGTVEHVREHLHVTVANRSIFQF